MSSESSVKLIEDWRERWEEKTDGGNQVLNVYQTRLGVQASINIGGRIEILGCSVLIPKPRQTYRPWKREEVLVDEWFRDNASSGIYRIQCVDSKGYVFIAGVWRSLNDLFAKWRIHRTTESGEWLPVEQCPRCGVEE